MIILPGIGITEEDTGVTLGATHQGEGVIHVVTPLGQGEEARGGVILEVTHLGQGELQGEATLGVVHLVLGEVRGGATRRGQGIAPGEAILVVYLEALGGVCPIPQRSVNGLDLLIVTRQEAALVKVLPPNLALIQNQLVRDLLLHLPEVN